MLDDERISGRELIYREHAELRRRLDELELLLARWEAGEESAGAAMRDRGHALYERLAEHIDVEEGILAPVLFASDDGEERALQLAAEHREQRDLLAFLRLRMTARRPTLLVCGEHDPISTVAEMRQIAAQMPQATFVEIPAAGHMAPLERPEPVNAAIREFLG